MVEQRLKNNISEQDIRKLCSEYLGSAETEVKQDGTAWIVSNRQGGATKKVVLKVLESQSDIQSASRLQTIHEKVRSLVEDDDRLIAPILGHNEESNSIIMGYVEGFPLLNMLKKALLTRKGRNEAATALQRVGAILADINAIKEEDVAFNTKERSNESYTECLINISKKIKLSNCLLTGHQNMDKFVNSFSQKWKERSPKYLKAVDVQPKNVFISENGITLIDPDYAIGNPAMNVAQVLVSIDQLGMVFPLPNHHRVIEEWKQHFLSAYKSSRNAYEWVEEDLTFFYPWALMQSYIRHISYRPMFTKYFALWYGRRVSNFICSEHF